jgi:hypothetical protein
LLSMILILSLSMFFQPRLKAHKKTRLYFRIIMEDLNKAMYEDEKKAK